MSADSVLATLLEAMRVRITRTFPEQIRAALSKLSDEQIWWRPHEKSNSVGNLVLHLTGSLNHYLNRQLGGMAFERDRDGEFAERTAIPRQELMTRFDEMVSNAEKTLAAITATHLGDASPEPRMNKIVAEDILGVLAHVSTHAGQILWITKMLEEGALDEVWIRTHRQTVWPPKPGA
jgi:uncharacterized damage-inducible protein DinB